MRNLDICPKCGYVKINMVSIPDCEFCKSELIKTDEDDVLYSNALLFDDDFDLVDLIEDKLYHKYVFNSPEFNQSLFDERRRNDMIKRHGYQKEVENAPKCPTCNSHEIERIGGLNKAASVGLFGVFAIGHVSKTFHCKKCGYAW